MRINTESLSSNISIDSAFDADPNSKQKVHLDSDGQLKLTIQTVTDIKFDVSDGLYIEESTETSITVRPTVAMGTESITIHGESGDVVVDITVGGNVIVGLSFDSL
jgi:hypothetical protein